jgi:hypothetical protein
MVIALRHEAVICHFVGRWGTRLWVGTIRETNRSGWHNLGRGGGVVFLGFLGQTIVLAVLILAVMAVLAVSALATFVFGLRRTLVAVAAVLPPVLWVLIPQFLDGGGIREFILNSLATLSTAEWMVLVGLLTVFTAMIWYASESVTITGCFLPLAAISGLLISYGVQSLDHENVLHLSDAGLIGIGTGIGAVVSAVIIVAVLRAVPQQVH